jgi:RHS repeat-associated protein
MLSPSTGRFLSRDPVANQPDVELLYSDEYVARMVRLSSEHAYAYVQNNPTNFVDPTGLHTWNDEPVFKCSDARKKCIDDIIKKLQDILGQREDCFMKVGARGLESCCRDELTLCLQQTIDSKIKIGCRDNLGDRGQTRGKCINAKNNAIPGRPQVGKVPPDATCSACDASQLEASTINFDRGIIPRDCDLNRPTPELNRFAATVLHELLHLCSGGHLNKGEDGLGRPDAATLAQDFGSNCGR